MKIKKRSIILFALIPIIIGYGLAFHQNLKDTINQQSQTEFFTNNIPISDAITLVSQGNIFALTTTMNKQISHNKNLSESIVYNNNYIAISKEQNYSSMLEINQSGNVIKILQNGNSGNIDTMHWFTDPAVNTTNNSLVFVSDKDKEQTQIPDNALFEENLKTQKIIKLASPNSYSGGIAHPVWDPINPNIILFDFYQYDPKTLLPYSSILAYDIHNDTTITLTTKNQNAYNASFSQNGKQIMFLGRSSDLNTVNLFIANYTDSGITNIHSLGSGTYAIPMFSYTKNHIYFLEANGNSPYNLYQGTIQNNTIKNILPITSGTGVSAISAYSVNNNSN